MSVINNIEKISLVVAVVCLIGYIVFKSNSRSTDLIKDDIRKSDDEFDKPHPNTWPPEPSIPTPKEIKAGWEKDTEVIVGSDFTRPTISQLPPPSQSSQDKKHKILPIPLIKDIVIEIGSINIFWDYDRNATSLDTIMVEPKVCRIKRKEAIEGRDFDTVGEVDVNMKVYKDKSVEPKTEYLYKVVCVTDDTDYINENNGSNEGKASDEKKAKSLDIFEVMLRSVNGSSPDFMASIVVKRFDVLQGKTYEQPFNVRKGDKIGEKMSILDIDVDFSTGYIVKELGSKRVNVIDEECDIHYDNKGRVIPHKPTKTERSVEVKYLIFAEEEGKLISIYNQKPKEITKLCKEHSK